MTALVRGMRIPVALALVIAAWSGGSAHVIMKPDPWSSVVGEWRGEGRFLGGPATATVRWESVLGGRFHRVTQRVTVRRGDTDLVFEGHGYYVGATGERTSGTWFDVEGHTYALDVVLRDDAIDSRWGPAGATPVGHTVYRASGDRLIVVDSMRAADGGWREFGRIDYTRARD